MKNENNVTRAKAFWVNAESTCHSMQLTKQNDELTQQQCLMALMTHLMRFISRAVYCVGGCEQC